MMKSKISPIKLEHQRRLIAQRAAQLMAENGFYEMERAKRKAARQLGHDSSRYLLPTDQQVHEELRVWQLLYGSAESLAQLRQVRIAAEQIMQSLAIFRPIIFGNLLEDVATRNCPILLELYPESCKSVEIFFINQQIPYRLLSNAENLCGADLAVEILWEQDILASIFVFEPPKRFNHKGMKRASLHELSALVAQNDS